MILYVDGTIREESRTKIIADELINLIKKDEEVVYLKLSDLELKPLDIKALNKRYKDASLNDFKDYKLAKLVKDAQKVVISTPFFDNSFSSMIKLFIENICIDGYTFKYGPMGPISLCKGANLYYVTTSGGQYLKEYSYDYIVSIFKNFFGYQKFKLYYAECLDIEGNDDKKIINQLIDNMREELK